jgi:hypothetical protein
MRRTITLAALAGLTLTLAACGGEEEDGIDMRPGSDCLGCHTGGEPGRFTAAGTVFRAAGGGAEGVTVTVTIGGQVRTTTTSRAGNFAFGQTGSVSAATVGGTPMPGSSVTGHCNGCHGLSTGALTVP